ncbi:MAG TPA: glycosyltransferase family 2 protein [Pyrinomonadaceae bacterium]|nr:glycosyltransferase family 2 protein [Pyrinomonadaceae bacterium]
MTKLAQHSKSPLTTIIVASYDRPNYLPAALDSIVGQSYSNLEIIVVDNLSSSSDEIAQIVSRYERVRLIQNPRNLGFTGAMNRGIEAAKGKYVYCTLDDLALHPDCIAEFVKHAEARPLDGLLSGILLNEDRETIRCAGGVYSLAPVFRRTIVGSGERDCGQFTEAYQVNYVPGGMVFAPTNLLQRLGGFRRQFFMYSEDTDLSARVTKAGRAITIVPQAKAFVSDAPHGFTHKGIAFHKIKNLFSLYLLHARLRVLPEFYLRYGVVNFLRALKSDRAIVWPMIKASAWFVVNAPGFIKERYATRVSVPGAVATGSGCDLKETKVRLDPVATTTPRGPAWGPRSARGTDTVFSRS